MGRFSVEFVVANNQDVQLAARGMLPRREIRKMRITGTVDNGASDLVLPKAVADKLGLPAGEKTNVHYADRRTAVRDTVQEARVILLGREGTFEAVVEPARKTALIGAIVLQVLDLLVDSKKEKLFRRDPRMKLSEMGSDLDRGR